ncbi:MAG: hypothetical protein DHS20C21_02650 [Gemmatimonadota bacterium]|nr:MAG: hypothetical protein DHS20C21_02650 [Gemmatimonadota bacterium]
MSDAPGSRRNISGGAPWESIAGYSRAVRVGPHVHVAGTTAVDGNGDPVAPGDVAVQTRHALETIRRALESAGASLGDVVRTRMYVTDMDRWEDAARVHGEFFGDIRPASTLVEVSRLIDPDLVIEIEADAWIERPEGI